MQNWFNTGKPLNVTCHFQQVKGEKSSPCIHWADTEHPPYYQEVGINGLAVLQTRVGLHEVCSLM